MITDVHKTVLSNGVRILTRRIPHVYSVSMGIWVQAGSRDESADQNGLSHFIEHMIFKGTQQRSAYDIAKAFDAIGGYTNAFTSMEMTCYYAKVLDSHLKTMVDILTDIFLNSCFEQSEIEKEQPVIIQEIGMLEDTPDDFVHQLLSEVCWGDHPLGRSILGTPANIFKTDSARIKDYFRRFYQPERIVVTAAGNLDHQQIVDLVSPGFEAIQPGNGFPERLKPIQMAGAMIQTRQLEQTHICLGASGLSATDARRYAFSLLNTIAGGNMSSRLFQEIRERRGLAYSIYSFSAAYQDAGMFGIYAGVDARNIEITLSLMTEALARLKHTPVSASELADAKSCTKGNLLLAAESVDNLMVRLAQNEMFFGREIAYEETIAEIDRTSASAIQELAAELFNADAMSLAILGPVDAQCVPKEWLQGLGGV